MQGKAAEKLQYWLQKNKKNNKKKNNNKKQQNKTSNKIAFEKKKSKLIRQKCIWHLRAS